jgi:hypothetical protein
MELKSKSLCYIYNKMDDIWDITLKGEMGFNRISEIYLSEFITLFAATILLIFCVSWWAIPYRIITLKINDIHLNLKQYDIKFICLGRDNNGNNK